MIGDYIGDSWDKKGILLINNPPETLLLSHLNGTKLWNSKEYSRGITSFQLFTGENSWFFSDMPKGW